MSSKVSDFTEATTLAADDIVYIVQTANGTKTSRKAKLTTLFAKVFSKTIFQKGINYGVTPQALTTSGSIDLSVGITAITATTDIAATIAAGTEGDEKIILVESNPANIITLTGTFGDNTTSKVLGVTGTKWRLVFHNGKWYI